MAKQHRVIESRSRTWKASLIIFYIKHIFRRRAFGDSGRYARTNDANRVPRKIAHDYSIESFKLNDYQLHTMAPIDGPKRNKHVVFLHGGAYVMQATSFHWQFLASLVDETEGRVTFVQYPLAPECNHANTLEHMVAVTSKIREQFPDDALVLAGDSAGGGLAIATVQELQARQLQQPYVKLALISPWLDVTSLDRLSSEQKAKEAVMQIESLKTAAKHYAGQDNVAHRHVSPLKGGF